MATTEWELLSASRDVIKELVLRYHGSHHLGTTRPVNCRNHTCMQAGQILPKLEKILHTTKDDGRDVAPVSPTVQRVVNVRTKLDGASSNGNGTTEKPKNAKATPKATPKRARPTRATEKPSPVPSEHPAEQITDKPSWHRERDANGHFLPSPDGGKKRKRKPRKPEQKTSVS